LQGVADIVEWVAIDEQEIDEQRMDEPDRKEGGYEH